MGYKHIETLFEIRSCCIRILVLTHEASLREPGDTNNTWTHGKLSKPTVHGIQMNADTSVFGGRPASSMHNDTSFSCLEAFCQNHFAGNRRLPTTAARGAPVAFPSAAWTFSILLTRVVPLNAPSLFRVRLSSKNIASYTTLISENFRKYPHHRSTLIDKG